MLSFHHTSYGVEVLVNGRKVAEFVPVTLTDANHMSALMRRAGKHLQTIEFDGGNHRYTQANARPQKN